MVPGSVLTELRTGSRMSSPTWRPELLLTNEPNIIEGSGGFIQGDLISGTRRMVPRSALTLFINGSRISSPMWSPNNILVTPGTRKLNQLVL